MTLFEEKYLSKVQVLLNVFKYKYKYKYTFTKSMLSVTIALSCHYVVLVAPNKHKL